MDNIRLAIIKTHISWFDLRWFGRLGREGRREGQGLTGAVPWRDQWTLNGLLAICLGQGCLSLCWYRWVGMMLGSWDGLVVSWDGLVVSWDGLVVPWKWREVASVVSSRSVGFVLEKEKYA